MHYTPFVLRFVRDFDNSTIDDVLRITPSQAQNRYNIVYSDHYSGVRNEVEQTSREVYRFVENIMTLLPIDEDPFVCVQMDAPTFPSVMIDMSRLKKESVQNTILDVLKRTLEDYPSKELYVPHPNPNATVRTRRLSRPTNTTALRNARVLSA